MSDVSRNIFLNTVAGMYANDKTAGVFIGGWQSKDGSKKYPSGLGIATSGLLAGAADDLYNKRRAEGRSALRSALGYLNGEMGAIAGGVAGIPLAPLTLGASIPIGAATGAAGQTALALNDSPWVHVLPTVGGAGLGALMGGMVGASMRPKDASGLAAGAAIGAGVGGIGGYALSRLMN